MALQPEMDVRLAAHGTDLDDLLHSEVVRRHARVDAIGQHDIVLVVRLDDRSRVYASAGPKRGASHHRVVVRDGNASRLGYRLAIILKLIEVLADPRLDSH